jgi:hypothetical protein
MKVRELIELLKEQDQEAEVDLDPTMDGDDELLVTVVASSWPGGPLVILRGYDEEAGGYE